MQIQQANKEMYVNLERAFWRQIYEYFESGW